jgi:hydrogenase expression/formation protein HypE
VLSTDKAEQEHALTAIAKHYGERLSLHRLAERLGLPLPVLAPHQPDNDGISLAVGDGTAASVRFVRDEILSRFPAQAPSPEDGSWCAWASEAVVVTTDSYVVEPFFPGGDIGKLAVSGTVNDLVASGASPRCLTMGLVLREGMPATQIRRILDSAAAAAAAAGVTVVAGDTKVVPRDDMNLPLIINTTGLGQPLGNSKYALGDARPGDAIIITGAVGEHALAVMAQRHGLALGISSDCASLHELLLPLLHDDCGVIAMRDPTRGGLAGVLADLAEATNAEVRANDLAVPIKPVAKEAAALLGVDPLVLANEGKMVLVVRPDRAVEICSRLRQHPLGRDAAVIGDVGPQGRARVVLGDKVWFRPEGIGIPRLC